MGVRGERRSVLSERMGAPRVRTRVGAAVIAGMLVWGLAGCAPEPGTQDPKGATSEADQSEAVPERTPVPEPTKNVEPPASFPDAEVLLPDGVVIDDVGERSANDWFVVLRAEDAAAASSLLDRIAAEGGYEVSDDEASYDGGRTATLTGNGLTIQAMTLPAAEGDGFLLSLDVLGS